MGRSVVIKATFKGDVDLPDKGKIRGDLRVILMETLRKFRQINMR
jgi:hypothetical protein